MRNCSRVLVNYGAGLRIDDELLAMYRSTPAQAVRELTRRMADALRAVTINTDDWATQRTVHTLRTVLKQQNRDMSYLDQFELAKRFIDSLAAAPQDLRNATEVYQLWLEVCRIRDGVLRKELGPKSILFLLLARTAALALLFPFALPFLTLHAPVVLLAAIAGRLTSDKEVISTLKLASGALLTAFLYVAIAFWVGLRRGWRRGAIVFLALPFCGAIALRVLDAAVAASRALPSLWRLYWRPEEAAAMRQVRSVVQRHAVSLLANSKGKAGSAAQELSARISATAKSILARL